MFLNNYFYLQKVPPKPDQPEGYPDECSEEAKEKYDFLLRAFATVSDSANKRMKDLNNFQVWMVLRSKYFHQ